MGAHQGFGLGAIAGADRIGDRLMLGKDPVRPSASRLTEAPWNFMPTAIWSFSASMAVEK